MRQENSPMGALMYSYQQQVRLGCIFACVGVCCCLATAIASPLYALTSSRGRSSLSVCSCVAPSWCVASTHVSSLAGFGDNVCTVFLFGSAVGGRTCHLACHGTRSSHGPLCWD
jgi:hypothetical protein